jgi:hypothetical protein
MILSVYNRATTDREDRMTTAMIEAISAAIAQEGTMTASTTRELTFVNSYGVVPASVAPYTYCATCPNFLGLDDYRITHDQCPVCIERGIPADAGKDAGVNVGTPAPAWTRFDNVGWEGADDDDPRYASDPNF